MSTSKEPNQQFVSGAKLLGDAWTLIIIEVLAEKTLRFSEIERLSCGICPVTLTDRLKKLEQENIVKRQAEGADKIAVTYKLTTKGKDILPILAQIREFSKKHHT